MEKFRLLRKSDGAAAVEFAIILPLFITLVFGIIEFSLIMYNKAMITNASREGARFGILFAVPIKTGEELQTEIETKVESYLTNPSGNWKLVSFGNSAAPIVAVDPPEVDVSGDYFIEVTVRYPYDFLLMPSFVPGLPTTMDIESTTSMRMENQDQSI